MFETRTEYAVVLPPERAKALATEAIKHVDHHSGTLASGTKYDHVAAALFEKLYAYEAATAGREDEEGDEDENHIGTVCGAAGLHRGREVTCGRQAHDDTRHVAVDGDHRITWWGEVSSGTPRG